MLEVLFDEATSGTPWASTEGLLSRYYDDSLRDLGAGEGIRTLDPNLGKVVLYP
jgi:hypothetical protein